MTNAEFELPPEDSYAPGTLFFGRVLAATPDLHLIAEAPQCYPTSVIVRITARFRSLPGLAAQRAVGDDVNAFRVSDDHMGPRLLVGRPGQPPLEARPWGSGGSGRLWRLTFWAPFDSGAVQPLELTFSWVNRDVAPTPWSVEAQTLQAVVTSGMAIWPPTNAAYRSVV
jgi:hypothetical protein